MSFELSSRPPGEDPQSILIYGSGDAAISMLALGFAQRGRPQFAWANCAGSTHELELRTRELLDVHAGVGRWDSVEPRQLEPQSVRPEAVDDLVEMGTDTSRSLLLNLLRLPPLLQELVSITPPLSDPVTIVLTRVDALPAGLARDTFGDPSLHDTLHRGRVTLVVTFHGTPALPLLEAFDRVFRIEEIRGKHWADSFVWSERDPAEIDLLLPQPLRDTWSGLNLNPSLLTR